MLTILLRGDIGALSKITLNKGDIMFLVALAIFGFYSALSVKRPAIHSLSFLAFTFGFGALCLIPAFALELATRPMAQFHGANVAVLAYVAVFPSILSYLCFNRGIELIGANRAAPFFHLIPVFGSAMAIVFLGEKTPAVSSGGLRAGTGWRCHRRAAAFGKSKAAKTCRSH